VNILAINGEMNITAISERTGLNHVRLIQHLEELATHYIIQEKNFGRIRIFSLNANCLAAKKLRDFFLDWKMTIKQNNRLER